jgi:ABC-type uncharacterized transport system substrate-binding protein
MRRRDLIAGLGAAAAAWPSVAHAQQKALPLVGFLSARSRRASLPRLAAFRQGLSEAGFVEGRSVAIEERWADGDYHRLPALAAELVDRHVVVIATTGGPAPALAAKAAAPTLPIVFQTGTDPVATGLVQSLARPGGNLTGVSILITELMAKRLELLLELVPRAKTVAFLVNPNNPQEAEPGIREAGAAARTKGIQLAVLKAGSGSEIDAAFTRLGEPPADALLVGPDPLFSSVAARVVGLAARHVIPAMYFARAFVAVGGLVSYGADVRASWLQLGGYVGKILQGAKPADLPVERADKFELLINLKTAKALGLTVPQLLLQRADGVIE